MDELDRTMEELSRAALENLTRDGHLVPMAVLFRQDGERFLFALYWENEEQKSEAVNLVKQAARASAAAVVYVLETWLTRRPKPDVPPSEDPDREEAVVLAAFTPSTTRVLVVPFTRDPTGKPVPLSREQLGTEGISSHLDPWPDRTPPS